MMQIRFIHHPNTSQERQGHARNALGLVICGEAVRAMPDTVGYGKNMHANDNLGPVSFTSKT